MKKKAKSARSSASKSKAAKAARLKVVNLKLTGTDRRSIIQLAKRHAKGNVSAWLRHTGLKYVPKKGETISLKAWRT